MEIVKYPIIILGAGASFDYIPSIHCTKSENWRPPLTSGLFNEKRFETISDQFPEIAGVVTDSSITVNKENIEEFLTQVREKALNGNRERSKQLVSLYFYLQKLFLEITNNFGGQRTNNYKKLVNQIIDNNSIHPKACIINFNYDCLLEENIPGLNRKEIDSYINNSIQVIKVHGSCDWVNEIRDGLFPEDMEEYDYNIYKYSLDYPGIIFKEFSDKDIFSSTEYRKNFWWEPGKKNVYKYGVPAIAIPISQKDKFVCPFTHIQTMEKSLQQANKILIIGWRGGDNNLIEIMKKYSDTPKEVVLVLGDLKSAEEAKENLKNIDNLNFRMVDTTFTDFFNTEECKLFFES